MSVQFEIQTQINAGLPLSQYLKKNINLNLELKFIIEFNITTTKKLMQVTIFQKLILKILIPTKAH